MTFTESEVLARLQNIFDDLFIDDVAVTRELSAHDVEEWDSLLHISLVVSIEEAFGIKFRVGEVESTQNVGQLVDIILQRLNFSHV